MKLTSVRKPRRTNPPTPAGGAAHAPRADSYRPSQSAPSLPLGDAPAQHGALQVRLEAMTDSIDARDDMALAVLEKAVLSGPEAKREIAAWASRIEEGQKSGAKLSVVEHTALVFLYRSALQGGAMITPARKRKLRKVLQQSAAHLIGTAPSSNEDLLQRLPRSVMKHADHRARIFHAAAFQSEDGDEFAAAKEARPFVGLFADKKDGIAALALMGLAFTSTGGALLAGAIGGYLASTLTESLMHQHLTHAGPKVQGVLRRMRAMRGKMGWLGDAISNLGESMNGARLDHAVVHHNWALHDYVTMFPDDAHKERVNARIDRTMPADFAKRMKASYGITLDAEAYKNYLTTLAPTYLPMMAGFAAVGGPAAIVGMLAVAQLYPLGSKVLHPFLHKKEEDALAEAGPMMRRLMDSRLGRFISRQHYVHHDGRGGSYNLMPLGDIIRGTFVEPNLKDLFRMCEHGILM